MNNKISALIGKFTYKFRKVIATLFLLLFVTVGIIQFNVKISYQIKEENKITDVFPLEEDLVILYQNDDEDKIEDVINYLSLNDKISSINSYNNTLGKKLTFNEAANALNIDNNLTAIIYYLQNRNVNDEKIDLLSLINFASQITQDESFNEYIDKSLYDEIFNYQVMLNNIQDNYQYKSDELSVIFNIDKSTVDYIFYQASMTQMSLKMFCLILMEQVDILSISQRESVYFLNTLCDLILNNTLLYSNQTYELFNKLSNDVSYADVNNLYMIYYANSEENKTKLYSLYDLIMFIGNDLINYDEIKPYLKDFDFGALQAIKNQVEDGKNQLIGKEYSRVILSLTYSQDSQEIKDFYKDISQKLDSTFDMKYYLIGQSAMANEISANFSFEYILISCLTALAIFITLLITFKKVKVALLLVCLIECAVFTTMSSMVILNQPIFFIATIIVQSILMGAMVDYGILMTTYYFELKKSYGKENVLTEVLKKTLKTILSSALIMIIVTFILSYALTGAVALILKTLSIGALTATLLIIFVLPSMLLIIDRKEIRKNGK